MKDEDIIELFFERSERAISETKLKYGSFLKGMAKHILRDYSDIEECENDTYLGAWNTIPPKRPQNLKSYMAKLIRNQSLKKYAYNNAIKRNKNVTVSFDELEDCLSSKKNIGLQYSDDMLSECINSFLESLNLKTRKVFLLRYWYYMTIKEIMQECNMSKSNVETTLFRTRRRLKEFIEERGIAL